MTRAKKVDKREDALIKLNLSRKSKKVEISVVGRKKIDDDWKETFTKAEVSIE